MNKNIPVKNLFILEFIITFIEKKGITLKYVESLKKVVGLLFNFEKLELEAIIYAFLSF